MPIQGRNKPVIRQNSPVIRRELADFKQGRRRRIGYHAVVHARDTSAEAAAVQYEAYRRLGPAGRFLVAAELTNTVRDLARAGIRSRHPAYSSEEVETELVRMIYGPNGRRS